VSICFTTCATQCPLWANSIGTCHIFPKWISWWSGVSKIKGFNNIFDGIYQHSHAYKYEWRNVNCWMPPTPSKFCSYLLRAFWESAVTYQWYSHKVLCSKLLECINFCLLRTYFCPSACIVSEIGALQDMNRIDKANILTWLYIFIEISGDRIN
jgi:hypothetical protein